MSRVKGNSLRKINMRCCSSLWPNSFGSLEIGKERGWLPATRAQFDALRGPTGALIIGDAEKVAGRILYVDEGLGGLSRITFQMGVSALPRTVLANG